MKLYQVIFRGGRVQNLLADRYSRQGGVIQFRMGTSRTEFLAGDLLMIDELTDDGFAQPTRVRQPLALAAAMG